MTYFKLKAAIVVSLLAFFLMSSLAVAQPGPSMEGDPERQEELRQRVEMMRIWKLTELLHLDEERAAEFFPRYRVHLTEIDSVDRQIREIHMVIEQGLRGENVNYADMLDKSFDLEKRRFELNQQLVMDSADMLNEQEQAALHLFETRYHQRLREMMMEIQRDMGPPGQFRGKWDENPGPGMRQRGGPEREQGSDPGRGGQGR
jgi:hypothetical protein